jgi:hypothetical protein
MKSLYIIVGIILSPSISNAYVDPGFLSGIYQMLYVFIFGVVGVLIFKPFKYLRSLFKKKEKKSVDS